MPKASLARRTDSPRPRASVSLAKYEEVKQKLSRAKDRAKKAIGDDQDAFLGVGTGLFLGYLEKEGYKKVLPTVMGLDQYGVYGLGGYLLTRKARSGNALFFRDASIAAMTVAAKDAMTRGSMKVGEDDSDEDEDEDDGL